jgi:hypothetical protein
MSGPTRPSPSPGGSRGPFGRLFDRLRRRGLREAEASENFFQALNRLSIDYAACFTKTDQTEARRAADDLLRASSDLIRRLPRWWMAESTPAFTAVSDTGVVYASAPSPWPDGLWPLAHQFWVRANGTAILGKQYVDPGPRFFLSYQVVSVQAELLAFVDRINRNDPTKFDQEVPRLRGALAQGRKDFETAAGTTARFSYLGGLALGLVILSPLSLVPLFGHSSASVAANLIVDAGACAVAGAAGALVSVLTRLTSESLRLDFRLGSGMLFLLGFARPIIGAVLALAVYWATVGGIVPLAPPDMPDPRFAFFIAIGFIAGFSERYAQDILLVRAQPAAEPPPAPSPVGESASTQEEHQAGA